MIRKAWVNLFEVPTECLPSSVYHRVFTIECLPSSAYHRVLTTECSVESVFHIDRILDCVLAHFGLKRGGEIDIEHTR